MKPNELMNAWLENSKAAMEPMRALGEVNKAALEAVTQQHLALTKEYMEFSARNVKLMTSVREPRALVDDQLSLAKEFGDKLVSGAEAYTQLATEYQKTLVSWTEKTAGEVVSKAEQVAKEAA